jgi:hypothetical protein
MCVFTTTLYVRTRRKKHLRLMKSGVIECLIKCQSQVKQPCCAHEHCRVDARDAGCAGWRRRARRCARHAGRHTGRGGSGVDSTGAGVLRAPREKGTKWIKDHQRAQGGEAAVRRNAHDHRPVDHLHRPPRGASGIARDEQSSAANSLLVRFLRRPHDPGGIHRHGSSSASRTTTRRQLLKPVRVRVL